MDVSADNMSMAGFQQNIGQVVPHSFKAGYIALSYIISYIGALTTLELLHRRTAGRGWYNWFLLINSSITMGGVAIWCMHFIGNRAIILGHGEIQLQVAYSSGFTALSFFVPISVLLGAFWLVGTNEHLVWARVALGGILAGLAICGMHYLGLAGISNYEWHVGTTYMVASAIVAIIATITALNVFFVLRAKWTNSPWKRAICAIALAGGVSGMHWVASVGTTYRLRNMGSTTSESISRNQTVIVVIVLSVVACLVLLSLAILAQRRRMESANRAQQIVLACCTFDTDGRLLVTSDGLLPSQKITNAYIEVSFDDYFNVSHPAYLWGFRVTRNWRGIKDLIPSMRSHLQASSDWKLRPAGREKSASIVSGLDGWEDFSMIFRELFCVAASELAQKLHEPLENIGVLYDEIMMTGTIPLTRKMTRAALENLRRSPDLEHGSRTSFVFGRGKLLFLVRRANKAEAAHLQASGFRFAETQCVVDILARSMQVTREGLLMHIDAMQDYSQLDHMLEPGVHLACYALRPSMNRCWDVLVDKNAKNQIPTAQLPVNHLEQWQIKFLAQMDGWAVVTCLRWLRNRPSFATQQEQKFVIQLYDGINALADRVTAPFFFEARLISRPLGAPCRSLRVNARPGQAWVISFGTFADIHHGPPNENLVFTPLKLFGEQQHIYKNAVDHDIFARRNHREFAGIVEFTKRPSQGPAPFVGGTRHSSDHQQQSPGRSSSWWTLSRSSSTRSSVAPKPDSSSEKELVDSTSRNEACGNILVSHDVSVDVREMQRGDTLIEMQRMGTRGEAGVEIAERESFADQLFSILVTGYRLRNQT
ncbi:MAG: hypothetical protein M1827_002937 [Pycnora praestabilis]|nr:MAG: hypothetical protein M1827_002937 [Pycnora praestabilis]